MNDLKLKVIMKKDFHDKINWFRLNHEKEIGGFIVGEMKDGEIVLEELLIPEQEVGFAVVNMEGKRLVKLRQEYGDKCKKILGEWHSHNTMLASWSGVDEDDFIKPFSEHRDISIFVVSGSNGHLVRLEIRKPFFMSIDKIPYRVEENSKIKKWCEREIKKKLAEVTYVSDTPDTSGGGCLWENTSFRNDPFGNDPFGKRMMYNQEEEISFNKQAKECMKFNGVDTLEIVNLSWFCAEALRQQFGYLIPKLTQDKDNEWIVRINFKNKKQALKHLKRVKNTLQEIFEEEGEVNGFSQTNQHF